MSHLVECQNLTKQFGGLTALTDVNLTLEPGKIIGLLGPNGSGKTTLIKLLNGLLRPTKGNILVKGNLPGIESKKAISYLPERSYLDDNMTVEQIIHFYTDFYDNFNKEKAHDMLNRLNINAKSRLKPLSKGTKEKVQLILVMSREADLYCLDEPIGGVDPAARDYILETILTNYSNNSTILLSTHLITDIENILDEVIFIQNGQLRLHSTVDNIRMNEGKSVDIYFREVFKC